jgi:hypothetical protein
MYQIFHLFSGFQTWLSFGLNEYLISNERNGGIISQNKEGVYSIFGKYTNATKPLSYYQEHSPLM